MGPTRLHGISLQEYWKGVPFSSAGYIHDPGIKLTSLMPPALVDRFFTASAPWEALLKGCEALTCLRDCSAVSAQGQDSPGLGKSTPPKVGGEVRGGEEGVKG